MGELRAGRVLAAAQNLRVAPLPNENSADPHTVDHRSRNPRSTLPALRNTTFFITSNLPSPLFNKERETLPRAPHLDELRIEPKTFPTIAGCEWNALPTVCMNGLLQGYGGSIRCSEASSTPYQLSYTPGHSNERRRAAPPAIERADRGADGRRVWTLRRTAII